MVSFRKQGAGMFGSPYNWGTGAAAVSGIVAVGADSLDKAFEDAVAADLLLSAGGAGSAATATAGAGLDVRRRSNGGRSQGDDGESSSVLHVCGWGE